MHGLGMLDNQGCRHTSEYVIGIVFPQQQWLVEHPLMLCYMHIACPLQNSVQQNSFDPTPVIRKS